MSAESKNYELAYLLSPAAAEGEILASAGGFAASIEEAKGIVNRNEGPRKIKLAYPIEKHAAAFFGWVSFSISPEAIVGLDKKLKSRKDIIRFLLVEKEVGKEPAFPRTRPFFRPRSVPREAEKREERLDLEGLDKKLEEILGK